jgi:polyisoprenoid-binding protein YceI
MTITETTDDIAGIWSIEPAHSEVGFTVRHLGLSKVRGRFNSFSGTIQIADERLFSSVEATIDLASVDTNNEQRDGHLRSADFFNADANPQMIFRSTALTADTLVGDLTINDVTRQVTLDLEFHGVAFDGYDTTRAGFSAAGQIKRSDFGINFNAPLGLDGALIGDKVAIELEIQAVPAG